MKKYNVLKYYNEKGWKKNKDGTLIDSAINVNLNANTSE